MTHSIPANKDPTLPNPFPLLHIPRPISLNISFVFCVVFKFCRRRGSSYAKEEDIIEKNPPIAKPLRQSVTRSAYADGGVHTSNTSNGCFCETRLHTRRHVVLVFLGLQEIGAVFLRHPRRKWFHPSRKNGRHERKRHVVLSSKPLLKPRVNALSWFLKRGHRIVAARRLCHDFDETGTRRDSRCRRRYTTQNLNSSRQ